MTHIVLPPDLLSTIFEHGVASCTTASVTVGQFLPTICLTSRGWNEIAYGTATLWTLVQVDRDYSRGLGGSFRKHRVRLERAKDAWLDVVLLLHMWEIPLERRMFWTFWEEVMAKKENWRTFVTGDGTLDQSNFSRLIPSHLPNLIRATIGDPFYCLNPELSIQAPRLRSYSVTQVFHSLLSLSPNLWNTWSSKATFTLNSLTVAS